MLPFLGEELFQHCLRAFFIDAANDLRRVMTRWLREEARPMFDGAAFRIVSGENDAPQPCAADGGSAHRARFESHVKIAVRQAGRTAFFCGNAQHKHFGVSSGVGVGLGLVARAGQNVAGRGNQHRADGNFAPLGGGFSLGQSHFHKIGHLTLDLDTYFLYVAAYEHKRQ